jgi:hypothetical protein
VVSSSAATPDAHLAELPADRSRELGTVRALVNDALAPGFVEQMGSGMITWVVPLSVCPRTYNGQPLMYAGLAAQKHHSSLYLMALYTGAGMTADELRSRWSVERPPDLGKSCLRFRRAADLDLELVSEVVSSLDLDAFVAAATTRHSPR